MSGLESSNSSNPLLHDAPLRESRSCFLWALGMLKAHGFVKGDCLVIPQGHCQGDLIELPTTVLSEVNTTFEHQTCDAPPLELPLHLRGSGSV